MRVLYRLPSQENQLGEPKDESAGSGTRPARPDEEASLSVTLGEHQIRRECVVVGGESGLNFGSAGS